MGTPGIVFKSSFSTRYSVPQPAVFSGDFGKGSSVAQRSVNFSIKGQIVNILELTFQI